MAMTDYTYPMAGRIALITGASSGLGARFARLLASQGAKVVLGARREEALANIVNEIEAGGGEALAVKLDVSDEQQVIAAYEAAERAFGTVDTVVANAGMSIDGASIDLDMEAFDQLMAVNVRGVFLTLREGAKRLIAQVPAEEGRGRMVIISSITSDVVSPGLAAYSASKAAVTQMGKVLARDWIRKGINVNMIHPGYIRTEINDDWFETEYGKRQIERFPRKRLMAQEGLDDILLFLCSDRAAHITGASFTGDDGQSL